MPGSTMETFFALLRFVCFIFEHLCSSFAHSYLPRPCSHTCREGGSNECRMTRKKGRRHDWLHSPTSSSLSPSLGHQKGIISTPRQPKKNSDSSHFFTTKIFEMVWFAAKWRVRDLLYPSPRYLWHNTWGCQQASGKIIHHIVVTEEIPSLHASFPPPSFFLFAKKKRVCEECNRWGLSLRAYILSCTSLLSFAPF